MIIMTDVYLVRHCETVANDEHRFAGAFDADVSERGKKQLEYLSEAFKDIHLDKVYSSSRIRARKTAIAINKYSGAPMEIDDAFHEVRLGDWEGQIVEDIIHSEAWRKWVNFPETATAPNGESREEELARGWAGLIKVVKENEGKTIAIATHGDILRNLCQVLLKMPRNKLVEVAVPDNVAINHIRFNTLDDWDVLTYNDTRHLPEGMITHWIERG